MDFITLERHRDANLESRLAQVAAANDLTNVFNPSTIQHENDVVIAFRAESFPGERPFRAFVARLGSGGEDTLVDLSAVNSARGIPKTADPKLVKLSGQVYATFNTGNVHSGENSIYLQRVTPSLGHPQRCVLAPRRMVEKNWAFFEASDGSLQMIYSLAPLTVWRLSSGELGSSDHLNFEVELTAPMPQQFPRLHIGSQPLITSDGSAVVVGNQQRPIPGLPRKIYFGRLVLIDLHAGRLARLSRRGLLHSWRSMLPRLKPINPGLFSATYFSGLTRIENEIVLSYGVNDTGAGIARVPEHVLWKS